MGGSGPINTAGELVSLAYNADAILAAITAEVSVIPILNVIMFALDILELAGIIPNPISLLIEAFSGRPRSQASLEQAGRLMNARNPAARQAGIMLERMVSEWNIVTSQSGSGREILDAWAHLFVTNLTAQGVPLERAQQILVNATSEAAQTGLPLEPELKAPLAQGLVFNAEPSTLQVLTTQYQNAIARGLSINDALKAAESYLFKNYGLTHLFHLQIGQYIPPTVPPDQLIPGQDGVCPSGYTLTTSNEMCTLNSLLQEGGGGGGGGGQNGPDPEGDEITNTLCAQMQANTAALISAIQAGPGQGGTTNECDCQGIISAIGNVVTTLTSIATAVAGMASSGTPAIDLSGVTAALSSMAESLASLASLSSDSAAPIVEALNNIAAKIPPAAGTDVSGITDAIKAQTAEFTVTRPIIDALVAGGYIDKTVAQNIVGGESGDAGIAALASWLPTTVRNFLSGFLGVDLTTGKPFTWTSDGITRAIADALTTVLSLSDKVVSPPLKGLLATIETQVAPGSTPPLGQAGVELDTAIESAISVAATAMIAMGMASYLGWDIGEHTKKIAEIISAAVGYEELKDVQIGPYVRHGIAKIADMNARRLFQQEIPGANAAYGLVARGLLDAGTADNIAGWNGLHNTLRPAHAAAAYSGFNARQMLRLIETGLFSAGDIADELNFAGMRPASQKRMLLAAPYLATASQRNQLNAALENAYVNGLLADADLTAQLDQAQQNVDRDALILARVQIQKRVAFAHALETTYAQELAANVITADEYRSLLQSLGLQDDFINVKIVAADAKLLDVAARQAAAEAKRAARATASAETKAAITNFLDGNIDTAALALALAPLALTPAQGAALVDSAVLRKAGGLHWVYGKQLNASDAAALRARVTALSDQRKRQEISDSVFFAALQALGIQQPFLNTIRSTADAMLSPKTAAVVIPVLTN